MASRYGPERTGGGSHIGGQTAHLGDAAQFLVLAMPLSDEVGDLLAPLGIIRGTRIRHDPDDPDGLSDLARKSIAGLLAHHRGISAICAPTTNAYKRLKPDMLNGYLANWGFDDRTVGVRVPPARGEGSRIEHRMADAAANPYLVGAAVLHAARLGVTEELELGPAQEPGADPNTDVAVPNTLEEALEELRKDTKLAAELGDWLVESFVALKQAEWDRYVASGETSDTAVTSWELDYYLPFF